MGLHKLQEKLLALTSVFRQILSTILECHCQIELFQNNAVNTNLSPSTLLYHILLNNQRLLKNKFVFNASSRHRVIDPLTNTLRSLIDIRSFDVSLLIALLKNVNATNCFKKFSDRCTLPSACCVISPCKCATSPCSCVPSCINCDVKLAVEEVRKLRNTTCHSSDEDYEALVNLTGVLKEFPHCTCEEDLLDHLYVQLKILLGYISDPSIYPLSATNPDLGKYSDCNVKIREHLQVNPLPRMLPQTTVYLC